MRSRITSTVWLTVCCLFILLRVGYTLPQTQSPKLTDSEQDRSRPSRQEIVETMVKIGKLSPQQQEARVRAIEERKAESSTPRSDFLFCLGSAYLGLNRAQICVGDDYEHGQGVVEDPTDAFVWYSIALDGTIADAKMTQSVHEARDRMKGKLVQNYPSPSDEELDAQIKDQKTRIQEGQKEAAKNK